MYRAFIQSFADYNAIPYRDAKRLIRLVFEEIRRQIVSGNEVKIDRVGRIRFKYVPPHQFRDNMRGGDLRDVGPQLKLRFKTSPTLYTTLRELALEMHEKEDDWEFDDEEDDDE